MGKRTCTSKRLLRIGGAIAIVVAALAAQAPARGTRVPAQLRAPRCPEAAIAWVTLPTGAAVDGVRVIVAAGSQPGAADVAVHAGAFDRIVHVRGNSGALQFSPPLYAESGALAVTLDPVWEAATPACVERIELLRGGAVVGAVTP